MLKHFKAFALYQSRNDVLQRDSFHGNCNVVVDNLLYSNIYVAVYYQAAYMDFKVEILWEQDPSQPDYKQIGLHGSYSSNFQCFILMKPKIRYLSKTVIIIYQFIQHKKSYEIHYMVRGTEICTSYTDFECRIISEFAGKCLNKGFL